MPGGDGRGTTETSKEHHGARHGRPRPRQDVHTDMAADMRNRFVVALSWPSSSRYSQHQDGRSWGSTSPSRSGSRNDVWQLLLSLPVIFWVVPLLFVGAVRALRARNARHDGCGRRWHRNRLGPTGRLVTVTGGDGDVFYEASDHARRVRAARPLVRDASGAAPTTPSARCSTLAPAMALVERGGEAVEVPTGEVVVGDLLLIRPGDKGSRSARSSGLASSEVDESVAVTGESLPVHQRGAPGSSRSSRCHHQPRRPAPRPPWAPTLRSPRSSSWCKGAQNPASAGQRPADRAAFWLVLVALAARSPSQCG